MFMQRETEKTYYWKNNSLYLTILIQPRAKRNAVVGWHDGKLKVQISAPPVDGKANECLCEFLAKYFGVAKRAVNIQHGQTGRVKIIIIDKPKTGLKDFFLT
jgi:uncharacterized protein